MSVLSTRLESQNESGNSRRQSNPVAGKIAIGIPSDEPALVSERLIGLKVSKDIKLGPKQGIMKGSKLTAASVAALTEAGIAEVPVVYGSFPTRLDHFRLVRQATHYGGFLEDPALYERYALKEGFTECPIVLTSEDAELVLRSTLVNYDRANKCVFCSSSDGVTAERLQADPEHGGYQEGHYTVECIPFHDDPRKKEGRAVCEFRLHGARLPCKFSGSLLFQLLPADPEIGIPIGQYFKIETSSFEAASNWSRALDEVKRVFGRIAFVPLKLSTVKVNRVYYDGDQRRDTQVVHTTLSVDPEYLQRYLASVEKTAELVRSYGALVPTDVPLTEEEVAAWTAEFNPAQRQKELREEGLLDDEQSSYKSGDAMDARLESLRLRARLMPAEAQAKLRQSLRQVTAHNIEAYEARVEQIIAAASPAPLQEQPDLEHDKGEQGASVSENAANPVADPVSSDEEQ